jgi:lysophospholipase L1-like esterase
VTLQASGQAATLTFTAPTVSGGAAPVSVACTPPSGSSLPIGTTKVTCIAKDAQLRADTCTFDATVRAAPVLSATRFVAFGDSITAGALSPCPQSTVSAFSLLDDLRLVVASIDVPSSYPAKLENLLRSRYISQSPVVLNEGLSGEKVNGGVTRLPGVLNADMPQALLLQEGVNDINSNDPGAIAVVVNGLQTMIRQARGRGMPVFLGTLLPERVGSCRAYAPALIAPANDRIKAMAASEGALLVDLYQAFDGMTGTLLGPDGLHPNEAGYSTIAQTFFSAIRERLEGSPIQP